MAYLHDERDQDFRDQDDIDHSSRSRERELTLSTGTILAVFFGLALSWGAFFAFGYNMGSKTKTVSTAAATTGEGATGSEANFSAFKPSSGTPAIQPVPGYMSPKEAEAANKTAASVSSYNPSAATAEAGPVKPPPASRPPAIPVPIPSVSSAPANATTHVAPAPRAPQPVNEPTSAPPPSGSFMVQIAAVTHQEDADLEMSSLKRRGYAVVSRTEPQDHFIHIQVGPFSNKKDAEAMRQRLIADGYLAIVK